MKWTITKGDFDGRWWAIDPECNPEEPECPGCDSFDTWAEALDHVTFMTRWRYQ